MNTAPTIPVSDVVAWLVEMGYPFDWGSTVKPPEALIRPLAEAWHQTDGKDTDVSIDDYEATIREEIGL